MKKIFKSLLCIAIVGVFMLQSCSAFFIGSDRYNKKEYAHAGITWEHNIILPDKYYCNGKRINQTLAENITEKCKKCNNYVNAIDLVINILIEKEKRIYQLKHENYNLKEKAKKLKKKYNCLKNSKDKDKNKTTKKTFKSLFRAVTYGISTLQSFNSDKYTKEEYQKAGIIWKHHVILPDSYYIHNRKIDQSMAENIAAFYYKHENEIKNNQYINTTNLINNISIEKDEKIRKLEKKNYNLKNCIKSWR